MLARPKRVLLDRNQPCDWTTAGQLLSEAIGTYGEMRMPRHVELAEALLRGQGTAAG